MRDSISRQEWVSVSERLPEPNQMVLVTVERMDGDVVVVSRLDSKYGFLAGKVTAWMPLPEPYKMCGGEQE